MLDRPEHTADIGVSYSSVLRLVPGPPLKLKLRLAGPTDRGTMLRSIFAGEDHILWFQRFADKRRHILIYISSHSFKAHFRAWAHAYVLAGLLREMKPFTGDFDREMERAAVIEALNRVNTAFDVDGGIEEALKNKGWNVEISMMCPNEAHGGYSERFDEITVDEKVE
jgi:hypothetical protein